MAQSFNLVARLQLQAPQNINQVVNRIESRLKNIRANVEVKLAPNATYQLKQFNKVLEQTSVLLSRVTNSGRAAAAALGAVATAQAAVNQQTTAAAKATQKAAASTKTLAKNSEAAKTEIAEFGRISALAVRRFLAFSIPAGIIVGLTVNIRQGIKAAIDFERSLASLRQVTGQTTAGLSSLTQTIGRVATTLGATSAELLDVSRVLSQAGLSAKETRIAMESIAKSNLAPTFKDMKETTEGVIASMRQFNIAATEIEKKLGSINAVAGRFAVESSDIISAIRRTGGAFKAAGGNLEELIALFTSVRSTTRESADSIATGFRTIFTRLQRPSTIRFLKQFGVELQDLEGKFVGPFEAVKRLNMALKQLDPRDVRFARITEELGGFRQVSKVIPLIQQFATSQQALAVALGGTESIAGDAAIAQETLAVQISNVYEEYQKLYREIAGSDIFKSITKSVLGFAKTLADVFRQLKPIVPMLLSLAAFKGAQFVTQFAGGFGMGLFSGHTKGGPQASPQQAAQAQQTAATQKSTQQQVRLDASLRMLDASVKMLAAETRNNSQALATLTTSVNALSRTIAAFSQGNPVAAPPSARPALALSPSGSVPTRPGGGRGRGVGAASRPTIVPFARGGVVPGTGNNDTVPAVLTPGEFVIKKSAVEAYGVDNLRHINRYEGGGIVSAGRRKYGNTAVGGKQTKDVGDIKPVYAQVDDSVFGYAILHHGSPNVDTSAVQNVSSANHIINKNGEQRKLTHVGLSLSASAMNPDLAKFVDRLLSVKLTKTVNDLSAYLAKEFAVEPTGPLTKTKFESLMKSSDPKEKTAIETMSGIFFEELTGAFTGLESTPNLDTFDFKNIRGNNLKRFNTLFGGGTTGGFQGEGVDLVELKRSSSKNIQSGTQLSGTVAGKAGAVLVGKAKGKGYEPFSIENLLSSGKARLFDNASDIGLRTVEKITGTTLEGGDRSKAQISPQGIKNPDVTKVATGGTITGQEDRVPALLTPGEFVINKRSAEAFGYDKLSEINGYNKGGPVKFGRGGVAKFAPGTNVAGVQPNASSSSSFNTTQMLLATTMMSGFIQTVAGADSAFGKLTARISTAIMAFQTFSMLMKSIASMTPKGKVAMEGDKSLQRAMVGIAAASALLTIAGNYLSDTAKKWASEAKTDEELQTATNTAIAGDRASKAGMGLGLGAAIGTAIAPGIGTAIGAGVGALAGVIASGFSDTAKEMRTIQRERIIADTGERMSVDLTRLLSGDINPVGSPEFNRLMADMSKNIEERRKAMTDEDAGQVKAIDTQLKALLPQLTEFKSKLIDMSSDMGDFVNKGGLEVLQKLALETGVSFSYLKAETEKEIAQRAAFREILKEETMARKEAFSTTAYLNAFNQELDKLGDKLNQTSTIIGDWATQISGGISLGTFVGGPGFGKTSDILSGGGGDKESFDRAIEQTLGVSAGDRKFDEISQTADFLRATPALLQKVVAENPGVEGQELATAFEAAFKKENGDSKQASMFAAIISANIGKMAGEAEGTEKLKGMAESDVGKLLEELAGDSLGPQFKAIDEAGKQALAHAKTYASTMKQIMDIEVQILQKRLAISKTQSANEAQMFDLMNPGNREGIGLDTIRGNKTRRVNMLLQGTGAAGAGLNFETINNARNEVNRALAVSTEELQGVSPQSEGYDELRTTIEGLNTESQRLKMAMEELGDTNEEASQIQKTLNALEEDKKARYDIGKRYAFGTDADRRKIESELEVATLVASGSMSLDDVSEGMRPMVLSGLNMLAQTRSPVGGISADGTRFRTGEEATLDITQKALKGLGGLSPEGQFLFGATDLSGAEISPFERSADEDKQIAQLDALNKRKEDIEMAFLQDMQTGVQNMHEVMITEFSRLGDIVAEKLEAAFVTRKEEEIKSKEQELKSSTDNVHKAERATDIVARIFKDDNLTPKGANRVIQGITQDEEKLQRYNLGVAAMQSVKKREIGGGYTSTVRGKEFDTYARTPQGVIEDLVKQGLIDDEQVVKIQQDKYFNKKYQRERLYDFNEDNAGNADYDEKRMEFDNEFTSGQFGAIGKVLGKSVYSLGGELATSAGKPGKVSEVDELISEYSNQLGSFSVALNSLDGQTIGEATSGLNELRDSIAKLKEETKLYSGSGDVPVAADTKAAGGPIFRARGTDTVPAMLTPGEFVVNRKAAQQNASLLESINNGMQYAAGGGYITHLASTIPQENLLPFGSPMPRSGRPSRGDFRARRPGGSAYTRTADAREQARNARNKRIDESLSRLTAMSLREKDASRSRQQKTYGSLDESAGLGPVGETAGLGPFDILSSTVRKDPTPTARDAYARALPQRASMRSPLKSIEEIQEQDARVRREEAEAKKEAFYRKNAPDFAALVDRAYAARGKGPTLLERGGLDAFGANEPNFDAPVDFSGIQPSNSRITTPEVPDVKVNAPESRLSQYPPRLRKSYELFHSFPSSLYPTLNDKYQAYSEMCKKLGLPNLIHLSSHKIFTDGMLDNRSPLRHNGGIVPGSGNTSAILQGGESVLSRGDTQRLARGGVVKYRQGGGIIDGGGGGGTASVMELVLSSDAKSQLEGMTAAVSEMGEVFNGAGEKIGGPMQAASASFSEAIARFEAAIVTVGESFNNLPNTFGGLTEFTQGFGERVGELMNFGTAFGQHTERFGSYVSEMGSNVDGMKSAAETMRDALAQDITISVNHTVEPITISINGESNGGGENSSGMRQMIMDVVGPEIDKLKDRIRNYGFGMG